jgi:hypothetical protein
VGLRRFYAENNYSYFKKDELLEEIMLLANFWMYVNTRENPDESEGYEISFEAKKWIHCLSWYPNDYWKYPVSVFFLKNRKNDDFNEKFCNLLKKEIAYLFAQFIITPTINTIRDGIYNVYISINKENDIKFPFDFTQNILENRLQEYTSPRITRALLLLFAYLNKDQVELLPVDFHIEHIFPQKWQNTNYNGWDEKDAKKYLEFFGNKVVFEQKLNIQAGNGYFGKKKVKYLDSKISVVKELGKLPQNDWGKNDIEERELKFIISIMEYFKNNLFN